MIRRMLLAATALVALSSSAFAQADYPNQTITMIVPFAAGGSTDTVGRLIAEPMTKNLGQQMIVENVGGAGGTLGAARVARAEPDGYTLLLHHIGLPSSAALYRKLPYDTATAFAPIGLVTDIPMTIVAKSDFPANSIGELLDYIRTNKDQVIFAHAGVGSASHLCGLLLMQALGTKMTSVGYKGSGPAMTDLLGGQVDMTCDQTTNTMSHIRSGKIKAYAVTTSKRLASLPDLPTLDEAGTQRLRGDGLARPLRTRGHAAAGDRQAHHGSTGGTYRPKGGGALRRSRHRARIPGASHTDRTEPAAPIRNR